MLSLQVQIDSNSGFCFGVVFAIAVAEEILEQENHLYCLGDIVHNDEEVSRLKAKGLRIINHKELQELKYEQVLIRAHGEPPSTYEVALRNNLTLIDASCPVVLKLQTRIRKSFNNQERIFIYGKKGHAEVEGLLGQTNQEAVVFQDLEELGNERLPDRVTLYSQTTKSTEKFYAVRDQLISRGVEVTTNDTICRQVSNRDKTLRDFVGRFDKIVFVAGTKSSNGKVLYDICRRHNLKSYFVSGKQEVKKEWFSRDETVGVCGATSTPMWLMEEVRAQLLTY